MAEEQKSERIQLLMTPSEVKAIDDWSFANRVRGRSEAIRQLIALSLPKAHQDIMSPTAPEPALDRMTTERRSIARDRARTEPRRRDTARKPKEV